ncbi:Aminoacyl-tRNA synthetase, class Ia domain-containing protein [Rozella allomycis CSF55]|uniref:Probable valine--tRNA ligase, cytoplasmic n=1 Tax=Rozella allomycis (strain CSF55) TaxID=988480 RepID=A0A075B2J5_ROZAC|nr:Aminoacyl-tRNA synthetase, class Ia domain-containing protein [Rozella allomycis CSF55]|eukprot:EPZ35028.1 Aminoacyl-tRNA synthetase, class Ia domain-containing protein [Rozella allomycis CSF55]
MSEELSAKQLEKKLKKEAEKKAKLEKLKAKQEKQALMQGQQGSKKKKEKDVKERVAEPEFVDTTVPGEKKDMSQPMLSTYKPMAVEAGWYAWWKKQGYFKPEVYGDPAENKKGAYVIPIPPPNVTGSLHLGHALTVAVQDALTRWKRMHGYAALYVPGCDHAGISTQAVVEKRLMKERKVTRHELGREKFLDEVWKWKEQYGNRIYEQFMRLGASNDWDRVKFTLDQDLSEAVTEAFVRLYEDGRISRGSRLVNFCGKLNTVLSNEEVDNKEIEGGTYLSVHGHPKSEYKFGMFLHFAYKVVGNEDEEIVVATTRPETILGDSGVAINPLDERYKKFHGKKLKHPFSEREIPIVLDEKAEMDKGTGAVKVTPAHDPTDFEIGKRHGLEFINILNDDNTINENGGEFEGVPRFEARERVIEALKSKGLYRKEEKHAMTIPICSRSGDIIEPRIKMQWFMDCSELAERAIKAVKDGDLKIFPKEQEKNYFHWLENIREWCLSRQLWWGHRIPAYLIKSKVIPEEWVVGRNEEECVLKVMKKYNVVRDEFELKQDEDVLDTWFSSGLWPMSIMGWPKKTKDFETFYPNSLLETGQDILFFWVIRMIMFGLYFTDQVPFKQVFLHPMVRDAHGEKMSKSKGNVVDPLDVIEGITLQEMQKRIEMGNLAEKEVERAKKVQEIDFPNGISCCGTDALRFGLCSYITPGGTINLDVLRIEGYKKFCNKIWNAVKFSLNKFGDDFVPEEEFKITGNESLVDKWILSRLNKTCLEVDKNFNEYNFMNVTSLIHSFWLYSLCDIYIESVKFNLENSQSKNVLFFCIEKGLQLLHPFMPFVTEELFQRLPKRKNNKIESICISSFPTHKSEFDFKIEEEEFDFILSIIKGCRSLISDYKITSNPKIFIKSNQNQILSKNKSLIINLVKELADISFTDEIPSGCAVFNINANSSIFLLIKGVVDIKSEIEKANEKISSIQIQLNKLNEIINHSSYDTKASQETKSANQKKIQDFNSEISILEESIKNYLNIDSK